MSPKKSSDILILNRKLAIRQALVVPFSSTGMALFVTYFSLGALYHASNIDLKFGVLSTAFIYALPSQIIFSDQWAMGVSAVNIILSVMVINLRQIPLAFTLTPILKNDYELTKNKSRSEIHYWIAMHFVAVTGWSNFMSEHQKYDKPLWWTYYFYSSTALMVMSIVGTVLGYYIVPSLSQEIYAALLIANPLYFLCILTRTGLFNRRLILAMVLGAGLIYPIAQINFEWSILAAGGIGGTVAFFINQVINKNKFDVVKLDQLESEEGKGKES